MCAPELWTQVPLKEHRLITNAEKTAKQTTDIILYDQKVIVFKMESDVMLYVVGSAEENEVLLYRYFAPRCDLQQIACC